MVPHYSGTTLEAQSRCADGVKRSLSRYMGGLPIEAEFLIVDNGKVVSLIEDKAELDVIELKKYIELVTKEVKQEQKRIKNFREQLCL